MICYNCGAILDNNNWTDEHIPPKNLYDGFDQSFKINRITVPACNTCNHLFSKIDCEIRDALAIKTEELTSRQKLAEKGTRSITRVNNWLERAHFDKDGKVVAIDFKYKAFHDSHKKNFKRLFYNKYGFSIPEEFQIEVIADDDTYKRFFLSQVLAAYLDKYAGFEQSGHPDILSLNLLTCHSMLRKIFHHQGIF